MLVLGKHPLLLKECRDTEPFGQSQTAHDLGLQYLVLLFFQHSALEWTGNEPSSHPQTPKTEDTQFRACL